MKSIEDMINMFTAEEWKEIITDQMDDLGLHLEPCEEYQYERLFDLDQDNNNV